MLGYFLTLFSKLIIFSFKFVIFLLFFFIDIFYLKFLPIILGILLVVAFFTLFERKILAGIQRRRGPNVVGILGVLQAFADAIKLLTKESIVPSAANSMIFVLAPIFIFTISLLS